MGKGSFVGYETIELGDFYDADPVIHMEAKGRWQILKWSKQSNKYRVVSEHPTERQARAIKILMEE